MTKAMTKTDPRNRWLDSVFEDFLQAPSMFGRSYEGFVPRVNITETPDHMMFTVEAPGMDKKDIKVKVTGRILSIAGEKTLPTRAENEESIREEIFTGSFERQFTLPESVQTDSIQAEYRNGILEIKLNKVEQAKPRLIDVKVS